MQLFECFVWFSLGVKKRVERFSFFELVVGSSVDRSSVGRSSQRRSSRRVPWGFRIFTEGQAERFGCSVTVCARMLPTKNGCCVFVFR